METPPFSSDDLNEVERRLSAWQPSTAGLASDAMLFAAGQASAKRGRAWLAWPIISMSLTLVTVALGVALAAERTERLALVRELGQRPDGSPAALGPVVFETTATEAPAPDGYFALRRQWEQAPRDQEIGLPAPDRSSKTPVTPEQPILKAWQPGGPLEPL
jgi:hypothetical protein